MSHFTDFAPKCFAAGRTLSTLSFPHALRLYSFRHLGWTGRQTFPDDIYISHLGPYQPFVGLYVNALQDGHLPINDRLDEGVHVAVWGS